MDFSYFLGFSPTGFWTIRPTVDDVPSSHQASEMPKLTEQLAAPLRQMQVRRVRNAPRDDSPLCPPNCVINGVAFPLCVRNAPSGLPRSPPTPSWRWTRRRTWASSSPTWWTWCTPGPTAPPLRKSARWRTCLKVRGRRFRCGGTETNRSRWLDQFGFPAVQLWFLERVSRRPTDCKFNQPTSLIKVCPPSQFICSSLLWPQPDKINCQNNKSWDICRVQ